MINGSCPLNASMARNMWTNLIMYSENISNSRYDEAQKAQNAARTNMIILGAVSIALATLMVILLTLSIIGPLGRGVQMMQEIAQGHLGTRLKMDRRDEIGALTEAMDQFADDLQGVFDKIKMVVAAISVFSTRQRTARMRSPRPSGDHRVTPDMLGSIREASSNLTSATSEILAVTTEQASMSSEQSAAVSETTSTLQEVRQTAEQASGRALQVLEVAQESTRISDEGIILRPEHDGGDEQDQGAGGDDCRDDS